MITLRMWALLRRRSAGTSDPQRLTGVLAVVAFAVTTAITLIVLGGWGAFIERANAPGADIEADSYPMLAGIASGLLLIPLVTLGGAAARLAVARRDERLAALRLAGATTGQVSGLTLLESGAQALTGGIIGGAGYFGLIPVVQLVQFQDDPFSYGELLTPGWVPPLTIGAVALIAMASAGLSLRKIAISPLGVAARVTPAGLHWSRALPLVIIIGLFAVAIKTPWAGLAVLVAFVLGGLFVLNFIGPWIIYLIGQIWAKNAHRVTTLLAARRLIDAPKTAWRSVGGVGLATFIAGLCAALAMFTSTTEDDVYLADMATGGFLTLTIAAIVAGVSTGVMQAGRIIDQRGQYRALDAAGMDVRVMNQARMRETQIPLVAAILTASLASALFLIPALTTSVLTSIPVIVQYLLSVIGAAVLVLLGAAAAGRVLPAVLR